MQRIEQLEFARNRHPDHGDPSRPHPPPTFVVPLPELLANLKEAQTLHLECQLEPASDATMQIEWFW
jgi:hypothetical protein